MSCLIPDSGSASLCGYISSIDIQIIHKFTTNLIMSDEIKSKNGEVIEVGDEVSAPYRGGQHVGNVKL